MREGPKCKKKRKRPIRGQKGFQRPLGVGLAFGPDRYARQLFWRPPKQRCLICLNNFNFMRTEFYGAGAYAAKSCVVGFRGSSPPMPTSQSTAASKG